MKIDKYKPEGFDNYDSRYRDGFLAGASAVPAEVPGVYYKVYQDRESMDGRYYVDTLEGIYKALEHWREGVAESDEILWPVIEPVEMTETEFKALPEFTGY